MRSQLFFTWAAVRWLLLMFVVVASADAPLVARPAEPAKSLRVWEGKASWYGQRFHGRRTANGEVFDMNAPTAAHRTLRLGSIVRLVNPRTGRARIVRINDRGPFIDDREIDVSLGIASGLGFKENGLARLRIELLEVPPRRSASRPVTD